MPEENNSLDNQSTSPLPSEEFVRQQFALLSSRLDNLSSGVSGLRQEMMERFLQLSRQLRHLDQKVDIFIQEQIYLQ